MEIVEATNDFQDWELLQTSSDSESVQIRSPNHGNSFDEIDSSCLIQANYFSLDSENRYEEHAIDGESVGSDNPIWIDPSFGEDPTRLFNKEIRELWHDSSSERSEDRNFSELEAGGELGLRENEENEVKFEENGEDAADLGNYCMDSGGIVGDSAEISDIGESSEVGVEGNVNLQVEAPVLGEEMNESEGIGSGGGVADVAESKSSGELEKRGIVWWKMPMEFLKYCIIKMSPIWTVSIAAAVVGFFILGRRLYKMKKKARGLEIKVAVDDKKASQVMSRAARLNEAFSVVKLVPVIRPSLPALGSTSNWTMISLR